MIPPRVRSFPRRLPGVVRLFVALLCATTALGSQGIEPRGASRFEELLADDGRIAFTSRSGTLARQALERADAGVEDRAAALFTLGAAGVLSERPRLESWAVEGAVPERTAAILGLGELGATGGNVIATDNLLQSLVQDPNPTVVECALLALLRTGSDAARRKVEGVAGEPRNRFAPVAVALIAFVREPESSRATPAATRLLELRRDAARRFGTIDGRGWFVSLTEELMRDDAFLDEVVLLSAAELRFPGLRDHLLQLLLTGDGPERLRAVVRVMPNELQLLVGAGLWSPASDAEWLTIVDEAVDAGVAALMPKLFERALRVRSVAPTAAGILGRGEKGYGDLLLAGLDAPEPDLRVRAAWGLAYFGDPAHIQALGRLSADEDDEVRAAALVARLQLGDKKAMQVVRERLDDPALGRGARRELLGALCRVNRVPGVLELLEEIAPELTAKAELAVVLSCLQMRDRVVDGAALRGVFLDLEPDSREALITLRALGRFPTGEDLEFLAEQFPIQGRYAANVELALALVRNAHPEVEVILQHAVWNGSWNRSVLAAAVVKSTSGMRRLYHWATKPPASATSADIRRLGFAIGELGGLEALRSLSRNMGSGADRPALQGALLGALSARTH